MGPHSCVVTVIMTGLTVIYPNAKILQMTFKDRIMRQLE